MTTLVPKFQKTSTGAVNRTSSSKLSDIVSVFDFMTPAQIASVQARDGLVDVTAAIQSALDCVPNYAGAFAPSKTSGGAGEVTIIFPDGLYAVSSVLVNNQRSYSKLIGEGKARISSTSSTYVIDMASCYYCDVSNFRIDSATAGVAIYMNRATSNPFCDYNTINNVKVDLTAGITANSGIGTIGLYMNRVEQNMFNNCEFNADCPLWNDNASDALFPVTNGTQETTITSNTINTFIQCNWRKYGEHQFCIRLVGAINFKFINNFLFDFGATAGANGYFLKLDSCTQCLFEFQCEVTGSASFAAVLNYNYFNDFNVLMNANVLSAAGFFNFDSPLTNVLSNGRIKAFINGAMVGKAMFTQTSALASPEIKGNIIETISTTNLFSVLPNASYTGNIYTNEAGVSIATATQVTATTFNSITGATASTASATPVTLFTVGNYKNYIVMAFINGGGTALQATATVFYDASQVGVYNYEHGANITLTVSGLDIQATQSSGAAQIIQYRILVIA